MKKSDLKPGYVVQYRNGDLRIVAQTAKGTVFADPEKSTWGQLSFYNDDLLHAIRDEQSKSLDIIAVYGFGDAITACEATTENRELLWSREEPSKDTEPLIIQQNFNDFAKAVHENAINHGWYDQKRSFGEIVALCHSELSEALEQYRDNKPMAYFWNENDLFGTDDEITDLDVWTDEKLEGVAVEMIDCVIRIFDWCASENIDIDRLIRMKHEFNKSREYKHGGKLI